MDNKEQDNDIDIILSTDFGNKKDIMIPISPPSSNFKYGWIDQYDDEVIECILRKDFEIDDELTFGRGLLTESQNKMIRTGLIVRYNKQLNSIQFLSYNEDGLRLDWH